MEPNKSCLEQDVSWTTMCCEHTYYGHTLQDVSTGNNTLLTGSTESSSLHSRAQTGNQSADLSLWFNRVKQADAT